MKQEGDLTAVCELPTDTPSATLPTEDDQTVIEKTLNRMSLNA